MHPFIRSLYFAYEFDKSFANNYVVVDINKYPEVKRKYDSKAEGKYLLIDKRSDIIKDRDYLSIQSAINIMELTEKLDIFSLKEKVAELIYMYEYGLNPEEYVEAVGKKKRAWKTGASWDSQPEIELCEWERDEYRLQAEKVLEFLKNQM